MKSKYFLSLTRVLVLMLASMTIFSCKKKFDEPPTAGTNFDTSFYKGYKYISIADLKAKHTVKGALDKITDSLYTTGIVSANDESGNLYKQIFIQDATGGIQLDLEVSSGLYLHYPVGRKVYVKCKDLILSDYGGTPLLGYLDLSTPSSPAVIGIPSVLIDNYVGKGTLGNPMVAKTISSVFDLNTGLTDTSLCTLIKLSSFEFAKGDTSLFWSDPTRLVTAVNRVPKSCSGESITVRTSSYANFSGIKLPQGNGDLYGIYTVYNGTRQLIVRDLNDAQLNGARCNLFEEDFGALTTADNKATFAFPGWVNVGEVGGVTYKNSLFGTTGKVVTINAFGSAQSVVTSWLITPPIVLPAGTSPKLNFSTAYRFAVGPTTFNAYISTDYNGSLTPSTATWTPLNAVIPANTATNNSSTWSTLAPLATPVSLSNWAGKTVYIAFKYEGGEPGKTTAVELDDIKVSSN